MMIMVYGGSGSGKSAFAERKITELNESGVPLYYLATMQVYGDEDKERIKRHRRQRAGKGFTTIEQPGDIGTVSEQSDDIKSDILLECMSNLVANEMFNPKIYDEEYILDKSDICDTKLVSKIKNDIISLYDRCVNLVIVSNNVFDDGILYEKFTMEYIRALGEINRYLAELSDEVWEVVAGIPIKLK